MLRMDATELLNTLVAIRRGERRLRDLPAEQRVEVARASRTISSAKLAEYIGAQQRAGKALVGGNAQVRVK